MFILFVRSPWGQNIIVTKAVKYISDKTHTKVAIEKLFITFDGDLQLDGLYLEDKKGDTLVYSKSVEANIPLWAIINGKSVGVDALNWDGLRANIIRKDTIEGYNFQFLIDAFESSDTTAVATDSTSSPINLIIGNLNFSNFNVTYNDAVTGIDSKFKIGRLNVNMETTNVENMVFDASNIELANANIQFIQNHVATHNSASESPLPKLAFKNIEFNNVNAYYESQPDGVIADVDISEFSTEIPSLNLETNDFNLKTISLKKSKISITTKDVSKKAANTKNDSTSVNSNTFIWPEIKLKVAEIHLENNKIDYIVGNNKPKTGVFNPNAIALSNVSLKAKDISLQNKEVKLNLEQFNFNEISGLNLNQLAVNLKITEQNTRLNDLNFQLNNNSITGYAHLDYKSLADLMDTPETTKVALNVPSFHFSLSELLRFQPRLKSNPYLEILGTKEFTGHINSSGTLASINLKNAEVNWGNSTKINVNGIVENISNPDAIQFSIPQFSAVSTRSDLILFLSEKDLGINLPKDVELLAAINGNTKDISANAKLTTTQGIATIDGSFKNTTTIAYNTSIMVEDFKVNELMNNPQFGALSLKINSKGHGKTLSTLDATLEATISKFQFNNYNIKDFDLNGTLVNGAGTINSTYKDNNLNTELNAYIDLDSIATAATVKLNLIGANLQALGLMQRDVKTAMTINADFKGNETAYNLNATVDDAVVVYDNRTYLMGQLKTKAHVTADTTSVTIHNKMVDLDLKSNSNPQTFSTALQRHISSYFYRDVKVSDTISNYVNLKLEGKISQSPMLKDVFFVNVKDIDTIDISVDFNEKARKLNANIAVPQLNYSNNQLDSLAFSMHTDKDNFKFNLGFKNITAGPLDVPKTLITGNQTNNELFLNLLGYNDNEKLLNVNTKITGNRERLKFTVNPDSLILNKKKWIIPATNQVILTNKNLAFADFKITKNNQSIELTDKLPNISKSHIAIDFRNFKISEIFNYLNPEAKLATGDLNGDFVLEDPFGNTGIVADLSIAQLNVLKTDFGTLSINGNSLGLNNYAINVGLKGGDIDFDLVGDYTTINDSAILNLNLDINAFKMKALNTLTLGEVKDSEGSFSGAFKISGDTANPQYNGALNFKNATVNVTKLNTKFTLKNEKLNINNDGLSMENFTVRDQNSNALVLSGKVGTENLINPTFNLTVKAENFQVINATKEDNSSFYGKATFNANAKLTGDLQIPKLDAKLTVGSDTDVTYVMPATYANVEERDGVVTFVNRENPDAIITQTEEQTVTIKGFDIKTFIKIGKSASATIVIDEETGDNFKVVGEGDLDFTMSPNGRINLSGVYEISDGHYELNLYNLVNRKFLIAPGSQVIWSGDPFDAKLDVSAIYNIETSAYSLMASQISGSDSSVKTKYRQVLPFYVYLNIDGELLKPEISFQLDMPEEDQGAISGQVYTRVQAVNSQEGELNRQVFSLLVLNRFYPDSGSDGSSGGFATIARDNLNDAVSDQLNTFSDKVLGKTGIELNFGLDSYTDYQGDSPTERTQLDIAAKKKLFNDRLIASVGSEVDIEGSSTTGEETPIIGNVSLEYILSEDGRYRLKGFRRNEFENIIDGQTITSGIALIFTQEFNQFSELWDAILRSQSKKNKKHEAEKKAAKQELENKEESTDKSIDKKKN
ncbi:translocation/assembly module TamB [Winogradskyella sp. HL2-2]|uniref:Translocation/assembly module TamB n=1 Tax=Winogradskyella endarachnes TaxID=2681965 RepID=A0A6L6U9V6_9FLAO|nr:translocation/assembly module TamB [Winogradskyella endarachnes]